MDKGTLIIIELIVVLGAVLAFGFWQLYRLRQPGKKPEDDADRDED